MIVIIDNYDSFTYNLVQYFKQMDNQVMVYRNDDLTLATLRSCDPDMIVLSPGPGNTNETGICREVLGFLYKTVPILGVCLGHQLIVDYFGGQIVEGKKPMHGKVSKMIHDGRSVFEHIPNPVQVTRYHSLEASIEQMPICLEISAMSHDSSVMAVRHNAYPVEGIQFHPESILTEWGFEMLENFYSKAKKFSNDRRKEVTS
ncbi:anthranilate synthase component II [Halobacillus campisalis]|uniref:Anthranilate synthase component II n=1 Tax=Halobacillus campisalis TaxID=435909 RepID=A0ABW2JYH8_9BACI|nr:aminodeoxychorismate/anthranilate synthase component II [Halobacillus campisalis]